MEVSKRSIRSWTELGTLLQQAVYKEKIDHIRSLLDLGLVELVFRLQPHLMSYVNFLSAVISICLTTPPASPLPHS